VQLAIDAWLGASTPWGWCSLWSHSDVSRTAVDSMFILLEQFFLLSGKITSALY
jgi:hypothetical protein